MCYNQPRKEVIITAKKYDLFSKSDMRKFQKDLEKTVMKESKSAMLKGKYDIGCPTCGKIVNVSVGKSVCPHCHNEIDFKLDVR